MDNKSFVRDLLSDPARAMKAYHDGGDHDAARDDLVKQATHLETYLRGALEVPAPVDLAASLIAAVQGDQHDRLVLERALMVEPGATLSQMELEPGTDPVSRQMAADAQAFEGRLSQALDIDAPADLPRNLTDSIHRDGAGRRPGAWITAVAASVFAIVGIALVVAPRQSEAARLQLAFSSHVEHDEPGALTSFDTIEASEVAALFKEFNAEATESFGDVHYARKCPIGDTQGVHIVMQQPEGAVTLLFVPDKSLEKMQSFDLESGISARMFPLANGVAALFGHRGQSLQILDQEISNSFVQAIAATMESSVGARQG